MNKESAQATGKTQVFKLGLTGSIATGKSTALQIFKELGHAVFSADDVVHRLYEGRAVKEIQRLFPDSIKDGRVNREILAKTLLTNPEMIVRLEALVHPMVRKEFDLVLQQAGLQSKTLLIVDIPLLFEGKNNYPLDAVAVTFCDEDEQKSRAMAREGMTEEKLAAILKRQMPQLQKRLKADFEIDTNLSMNETQSQIVEIAAKCLELWRQNNDNYQQN